MTKEELLETIVKSGFTKVDIHRRIRLFREYLEQLYFGKGDKPTLTDFLVAQKASDVDSGAIQSWGEAFYQTFNKDNAYELMDTLDQAVKSLKLTSLYVPYDPTPQDVIGFGTWMRANADPYMILDIHVDASVFGGCAVVSDGMYHDYSLRGRLFSFTPQIHDILEKFVSQ